MMDENPDSKYGIICPIHGKQGITQVQYDIELSLADSFWHCPIDFCPANDVFVFTLLGHPQFDEDRLEKMTQDEEPGNGNDSYDHFQPDE